MANISGNTYGLTALSPILRAEGSKHSLEVRRLLAEMPRGEDSPFARVTATHMCRLVVMDDVPFVGHPAAEDHLLSSYLIFECNFHGTSLDAYLAAMKAGIPDAVHALWSHCAGYRGLDAWPAQMKKCQIKTSLFFADVNDRSVEQTLKALQVQAEVSAFVLAHQGKPAAEIQAAFQDLVERLRSGPTPAPGALYYETFSKAAVAP
ncbi:MAG: hypothetical protein ACRD44_00450 [Bryobacteraceae bacterium]